ncbi:MAG: hypothetical protein WB508_06095 [Aeromicrobium sp.]|uniref:hypothetical protein n=1 Tax=Aeromicrobium sp. TaxID=1871063 RepID=UPI003C3D433B
MDETTFDIDKTHLAEASRRFPADRLAAAVPHPRSDMSYLASPTAEFGRHAWDESGH